MTTPPTPTRTPTPLTDAVANGPSVNFVKMMVHARALEIELAALRAENVRLTEQIADDNRAFGCELRAPCVTIWEQAALDHARAERAEAALAEWSVLKLWGGTPEHVHEFIKGQQARIYAVQDAEKDSARLDWLQAHAFAQHSTSVSISDLGRHYNGFPGSLRDAIDAAMTEAKP